MLSRRTAGKLTGLGGGEKHVGGERRAQNAIAQRTVRAVIPSLRRGNHEALIRFRLQTEIRSALSLNHFLPLKLFSVTPRHLTPI